MATILIVDDDPETRQLYVSLLSPLGHKVIEASDGEKGIRAATESHPALVISDVLMPNISGYEFVSRLRQLPQFATVPFIFQSASLFDHQTRALGATCGVTHFIPKPSEPETILEVVHSALGSSAQLPPAAPAPPTVTEHIPWLLDAVYERSRELEAVNHTLEQRLSELAATNQELEAFTYTVAHDLRAPVRHISAFGELLSQKFSHALPDDGRMLLNRILRASHQMGVLVDDLLRFSRLGRVQIQRNRVDLNRIVQAVRLDLKPDLEGRDIDWQIQELPEIEGDQSLLYQAIANLVSNAVKYSQRQPHAQIEIGTSESGGENTVIFVRDNGAGFEMEYAAKLFQVFERLHAAEEYEGNGIGLAIVKRIVDHHGGRVWAEGSPGKGATFYLSLPAGKGEYAKPRERAAGR